MRLGKIQIEMSYVVDLDDEDMVQHARDALAEDVASMTLHDGGLIPQIITEGNFSENDIPEFLLDDGNTYLIRHKGNDCLYWKDGYRWVNKDIAQEYESPERYSTSLPEKGEWIQDLDAIVIPE